MHGGEAPAGDAFSQISFLCGIRAGDSIEICWRGLDCNLYQPAP
jgi:hypothetical protein